VVNRCESELLLLVQCSAPGTLRQKLLCMGMQCDLGHDVVVYILQLGAPQLWQLCEDIVSVFVKEGHHPDSHSVRQILDIAEDWDCVHAAIGHIPHQTGPAGGRPCNCWVPWIVTE
jgi:hypothetical protein